MKIFNFWKKKKINEVACLEKSKVWTNNDQLIYEVKRFCDYDLKIEEVQKLDKRITIFNISELEGEEMLSNSFTSEEKILGFAITGTASIHSKFTIKNNDIYIGSWDCNSYHTYYKKRVNFTGTNGLFYCNNNQYYWICQLGGYKRIVIDKNINYEGWVLPKDYQIKLLRAKKELEGLVV